MISGQEAQVAKLPHTLGKQVKKQEKQEDHLLDLSIILQLQIDMFY